MNETQNNVMAALRITDKLFRRLAVLDLTQQKLTN